LFIDKDFIKKRTMESHKPPMQQGRTINTMAPSSNNNLARSHRRSSSNSILSASSSFNTPCSSLTSPPRLGHHHDPRLGHHHDHRGALVLLGKNVRQLRQSIRRSREDIFGDNHDGTRLAVENVREIRTYVHELVDAHDPCSKFLLPTQNSSLR
jgi:hypothetical protein